MCWKRVAANFWGKEETGIRHKEANEIADAFQPDKKEESPTTIVLIIMVPSLDSDSPFRRGPLVDSQRAKDLGTSSAETTNTSRRSLTGTSSIPQIIERGGTLTSAAEESNSFHFLYSIYRNKHRNSQFKSANNKSKTCDPFRGENKVFHKGQIIQFKRKFLIPKC